MLAALEEVQFVHVAYDVPTWLSVLLLGVVVILAAVTIVLMWRTSRPRRPHPVPRRA